MKKIVVAAALAVVMVAVVGLILYTSQSQAPVPTDDLTEVEQQLNDLEDYLSLENLERDLDIGDMLGSW